MPDHVHLLFEPQIKEQDKEGNPIFWSLSEILQWHQVGEVLITLTKLQGRKAMVWEKESDGPHDSRSIRHGGEVFIILSQSVGWGGGFSTAEKLYLVVDSRRRLGDG